MPPCFKQLYIVFIYSIISFAVSIKNIVQTQFHSPCYFLYISTNSPAVIEKSLFEGSIQEFGLISGMEYILKASISFKLFYN